MTDTPDLADEQVPQQAEFEFPCDNCGADMTWEPARDALWCAYCEHVVKVPRGEGLIVERPLSAAGDALRGYGLEVRVARCDTCGARVTFEGASTAESCLYCGSASVLDQAANRNAIRPESLVPLDVARADVERLFRAWLRGLWFRPNTLKKTRRFEAVGLYVPFWTYDCRVHSQWSADAGYYYYVTQRYTVMVNGKPQVRTRQVRKVRWVPAWGERRDRYDDELVCASQGLPASLLAKLGPYDTTDLVPYRPEYLAGWHAEEYQLDLASGWSEVEARVVARQRDRCAADVPGDTLRALAVKNRITEVRWKHVLLPLWSLRYRHGGKTYTVLVHGQTGRVAGKAPLSWVKILLAVLAAASIALAVVALAS